MLFCYWRLNYTFFRAVFQVRSEAFMEMRKWGLKKRLFIQIHSTLITSHHTSSSESASGVRAIVMIILMNMYLYSGKSGDVIVPSKIPNSPKAHLNHSFNIYHLLFPRRLERWRGAWLMRVVSCDLSSRWNSF